MFTEDLYKKLACFPGRSLTFVACNGSTITRRYLDICNDVERLISELRDCGLKERDVVGLLGGNCYEWVVADLALLGLDCVSVALPVEIRKELTISKIAERYGISALLLTKTQVNDEPLPPWASGLDRRPITLLKRPVQKAEPLMHPDIFSVAFSSGTSGKRKGLLMSKAGIRNTVITSGQAWDVDARDHILIVMPFSNFQQRYLLYMALWFGFDASVVMPERMFQELRNLSPTIIVGPPSFFEFLENRINAEPLSAKTTLFLASAINAVLPFHVGRRLARLLCRSWTAVYGSRVRLMFVGSAPTRAATVRLFHRIGLPLFEAYGLTEAGWISFNLPASHCIGSVGRSASGVDISVADDHEILVRSEHPQALGYAFDGVEDQKAVFLPDLTIATGDLGRIDGSGFLHLVGRKKNVIVTRSGLKINPEEIEADIENACQITKAVVADAGRRAILTCVIWLDDWQSEDRTRDIKLFVDSMNKRRAPSHRIGDIVFRPSGELTSDNGLLTRNCKVNRIAVMDKYFNGRNREASWQ